METPPKKFFRLVPGGEVRLRYAYIIKCISVTKDPATGAITELHCTYDSETKSGMPQADRKVKGTIHWVSARDSVNCEVRLYDKLFNVPDPDALAEDYLSHGVPFSKPLQDTHDGLRGFELHDADGYVLFFGRPR